MCARGDNLAIGLQIRDIESELQLKIVACHIMISSLKWLLSTLCHKFQPCIDFSFDHIFLGLWLQRSQHEI